MTDAPMSSDREGATPALEGQSPSADEVFPLVTDLSQTLLDWSWEGTIGLQRKVERVANAYDKDVVTLVSAESAVVQMGEKTAFLKSFPGIPPLAGLDALKALLIEIEAGKLGPVSAREKLQQVHDAKPIYSRALRVFGTMLLSFAFAIDIVGTWEACVVAFLTGIISGVFQVAAGRGLHWALFAPFMSSFFVALSVFIAFDLNLVTEAPGILLIPALFVFIPGDSITMQAVEMMDGRWSAAVSRLFYSIMLLVLLALGAVFAAAVVGADFDLLVPGDAPDSFPWWAVYPGHIIFTIGVALSFQMRMNDLLLATIVTLVVTAVGQAGAILFAANAGTFLAAVAMTVMARYLARDPKRPPAWVFLLTPFFTLTPGSHGLRAFESLVGGQPVAASLDISSLFGTLIVISVGMIAGVALTFKWRSGW